MLCGPCLCVCLFVFVCVIVGWQSCWRGPVALARHSGTHTCRLATGFEPLHKVTLTLCVAPPVLLLYCLQIEEGYRSTPSKQERGELFGALRQQVRDALVLPAAASPQQPQQPQQQQDDSNGAAEKRYAYPTVSMALKVRRGRREMQGWLLSGCSCAGLFLYCCVSTPVRPPFPSAPTLPSPDPSSLYLCSVPLSAATLHPALQLAVRLCFLAHSSLNPGSFPVQRVESAIMRRLVLEAGFRADGRGVADVRPIWSRAAVLPRTHGSVLFTRGETQALAVTTLGCNRSAQRIDSMSVEDEEQRFYLQYSFPPSSVGETGRTGAPGRREVGHGNLAGALRVLLGGAAALLGVVLMLPLCCVAAAVQAASHQMRVPQARGLVAIRPCCWALPYFPPCQEVWPLAGAACQPFARCSPPFPPSSLSPSPPPGCCLCLQRGHCCLWCLMRPPSPTP